MEGRPLTNEELWEQLIPNNTGRNAEFRHRNRLLILLATIVGLREIELTLITNKLFVAPGGELNEFIILPEEVTRDGQERPVIISHPELQKAFESYWHWLIENKINSYPHKRYLGLDPNAAVFVGDYYKPYTTQSNVDRLKPAAMTKQLDTLIKNASLWDRGVRRISLVRAAVIALYRGGLSSQDVSLMTGFSKDSIAKILTMDIAHTDAITDWFDERIKRKEKLLKSRQNKRQWTKY